MTVDFLTIMSQGCNLQVLVSPEKKKKLSARQPCNTHNLFYRSEDKCNFFFFFLVNCSFYLFIFIFGHTACGILGF